MIALRKTFSQKEILEIVKNHAIDNLPPGLDGELYLEFTEDDEIEVIFTDKSNNIS